MRRADHEMAAARDVAAPGHVHPAHDPAEVRALLWQLLGWQSRLTGVADCDYRALDVSDRLVGGIVGCGQRPPLRLPYVQCSLPTSMSV